MIRFALCQCLVVLSSAAMAEQFSLQCVWYEPYFVTFDTDGRRVVFESPAGSALAGRIHASTTEKIDFDLLRAGQSKFDLTWSHGDGKLTWIGLPGDPSRPTVVHECSRTTKRPILSSYDSILP
jgi:hypothetical protein